MLTLKGEGANTRGKDQMPRQQQRHLSMLYFFGPRKINKSEPDCSYCTGPYGRAPLDRLNRQRFGTAIASRRQRDAEGVE